MVCDTNTVVSALVFAGGRLGWLRAAWRDGRVVPVVSRDTVSELLRVLAYPKFRLDEAEREDLLGDFLPGAELCAVVPAAVDVPSCRDPADQMFLDLAHAAGADLLVSGDADLLALRGTGRVEIATPAQLRERLGVQVS